MREVMDYCISCPSMGLDCLGSSCQYHEKQEIVYCDKCERDSIPLYFDGKDELCALCLMKKYLNKDKKDLKVGMSDLLEELAEEFAETYFECSNADTEEDW